MPERRALRTHHLGVEIVRPVMVQLCGEVPEHWEVDNLQTANENYKVRIESINLENTRRLGDILADGRTPGMVHAKLTEGLRFFTHRDQGVAGPGTVIWIGQFMESTSEDADTKKPGQQIGKRVAFFREDMQFSYRPGPLGRSKNDPFVGGSPRPTRAFHADLVKFAFSETPQRDLIIQEWVRECNRHEYVTTTDLDKWRSVLTPEIIEAQKEIRRKKALQDAEDTESEWGKWLRS